MKVRELVGEYKELIKEENLRDTTIIKYVNSLDRFLTRLYSRETDIDKINVEDILQGLKDIKMKSETSAVVNGLRRLKNKVNIPQEAELKNIIKNKTEKKKNNEEVRELRKILKKINVLRDKKLKLAYRLSLVSGLRVFELSDLKKEDIEITEEGIKINVRDGKGGKGGFINCLRDKYLEKNLAEHLESINDEKVFYSKKHMMNRALESGFECHDLRRAFCKLYHYENKKEIGSYRANIKVKNAMRHIKFSTTRIYLNSKIKVR